MEADCVLQATLWGGENNSPLQAQALGYLCKLVRRQETPRCQLNTPGEKSQQGKEELC